MISCGIHVCSFPLLPACPKLPAPVKNTVLGWTHLSPDPVQHSLCSLKDKNPSLGEGCLVERWDSEFWEQLNEKWQPFPADQYGQGTGKTVWPGGWSSPQNTVKASLVWCNAVICVHLLVMQQLNSLRMLKKKKRLRKLTHKLSLHYMSNSEVLYAEGQAFLQLQPQVHIPDPEYHCTTESKIRSPLIQIILLKYLWRLKHGAIDLPQVPIWGSLWGMYKLCVC